MGVQGKRSPVPPEDPDGEPAFVWDGAPARPRGPRCLRTAAPSPALLRLLVQKLPAVLAGS